MNKSFDYDFKNTFLILKENNHFWLLFYVYVISLMRKSVNNKEMQFRT